MSDVIKCKLCNKIYSSMSSRSNHIKRVHNNMVSQNGKESKDKSKDLGKDNLNENKFYECRFCDKTYKHKQTRFAHEKICKLKDIPNKETKNIQNTTIQNTTIQTANNIQNNNIIDNKQIVINNYGNNNLDYITDKFKNNLMTHFLFEDEYKEPIPKLIENINFNPNHKENNNVKITSLRSKIGYKYTHQKWVAVDKNKLLEDLFKMGNDIIEKFIEERQNMPKNIQEGYCEYQASVESLQQFIKKEIEMISYLYFKNSENELDI